jgi:hypothetical protein
MTKEELVKYYLELGGKDGDLRELDINKGKQDGGRVFYYKNLIPHLLLGYVIDSEVRDFISLDVPNSESNLRVAHDLICNDSFIDDPFARFFADFAPGEVMDESNSFLYSIKSSTDKNDMRQKMDLFIDKIPKVKRFRDDITLVADELFTNAVFNAPFPQVAQDRTGIINLKKLEQGELMVMHTPGNIHIGCSDPHGGLQIYQLLEKLKDIYDRGVGKTMNMNAEEGGGGIGHWMMYERTESMLIAVKEGVRTVIIFTVPLIRCKNEHGWYKSIHIKEY